MASGSSPRMRGKLPREDAKSMPRLDHPRACGANVVESFGEFCGHGSSPRMRGKPLAAPGHMALARIIPAHAGQTSGRPRCAYHETDHPRACGANRISLSTALRKPGSSPRMRGKHPCYAIHCLTLRIIPAHAGQTSLSRLASSAATDHPRACGANFSNGKIIGLDVGSSPRMRGKPTFRSDAVEYRRIIPAHAGQTRRRLQHHQRLPDHPRACGANHQRTSAMLGGIGSSPRMRGKPGGRTQRLEQRRIIPAHAGQTTVV